MRKAGIIGHIAIVLAGVFLLAFLPIATSFPLLTAKGVDETSSASVEIGDQPSGDFIVLINSSLHADSMREWDAFFHDEDFAVIFEDIKCIVAEGDATGLELAERFQAQLPENQMELRTENPTLLVSKAETGNIDVAVFSREMASALQLDIENLKDGIEVFEISGGSV